MMQRSLGMVLAMFTLAAAADPYYVGNAMTFASYMQDRGYTYKENNQPADPFASVRDHGANIVRLEYKFGPYDNSFTEPGKPADWAAWDRVVADIQHAKSLGLEVFLTFTYNSTAPAHAQPVINTVPDEWAHITSTTALAGNVYDHTHEKLNQLGRLGVLPAFVSIGNEVNAYFMHPTNTEPTTDPARNTTLMNAGFQAVRDIAQTYNHPIKTAAHIFAPQHVRWWLEQHTAAGINMDVLALSWYPGMHEMGEWDSFKQLNDFIQNEYGKQMFILETAASWGDKATTTADKKNNIYNNPEQTAYSPQSQRDWLAQLAIEVIEAGGLGVITWGADHTGSDDIVIYPDKWGPYGSAWENNAIWDSTGNLHDGADWTQQVNQHFHTPEPGMMSVFSLALPTLLFHRRRQHQSH